MSVKNQRSGYKGVITKKIATIDDKISSENIVVLAALRNSIQTYLDKVQKCDEIIYTETQTEDQERVLEEQANYSEEIETSIEKINLAIDNITKRIPVTSVQPVATNKLNVKLPKLDIPPYEGDVSEWRSFWELFSVSVHARGDIENVQKFSYLRTLLKGEALELVSGFSLESATYLEAVDLLEKTYGKTEEIKLCLVKKLLATEHSLYDAVITKV